VGDDDVRLTELSAVVIDFETTGLYPNQGDEIIELGAMYLDGLEIRTDRSFSRLVNPGRPVSEAAFKVHRIPDELLAIQPPIAQVLPDFISFLGDRLVIGQNVAFDLSFLVKAMRRHDLPPIQNLIFDTKWLSKLAFPHMTHHSLDAIAQRVHLERPPDRHRAMGDVVFTAEILVRLLKRCLERGYERIGDLIEAYDRTEGGKHGNQEVLLELQRCFEQRHVAEIAYAAYNAGPDQDEVLRRVSIYHMSPPYFLGFCHTRHAIRTFRVDRVARVQPLEDAYGIPEDFHPQDHFLRR
jgi:DNA polymerase III epsilon subunit family exonuclease